MKKLVFDGDGSQFLSSGAPCSICGVRQTVIGRPYAHAKIRVFIRVREKLPSGGTSLIGFVCPQCVARLFLQTTRLGLWNQVSGTLLAAIRRCLSKLQPSNRLRA